MSEDLIDLTPTLGVGLYPNIRCLPEAPPEYEEFEEVRLIDSQIGIPPTSSAPPAPSDINTVKLDIGGTVFKTTIKTLTKFDGLLKGMMDSEDLPNKDQFGAIFIDRSPQHFHKILNFLRDGHVDLPESTEQLGEIQKEAQYYLLDGLVGMCDSALKNKKMNRNVQVVESDAQLFHLLSDCQKPTLVIYYHVDAGGRFVLPFGFCVETSLKSYKNTWDIFYKPFYRNNENASALGTSSSCWIWTLHYRGARLSGGPKYDKRGNLYKDETFLEQLEIDIVQFILEFAIY